MKSLTNISAKFAEAPRSFWLSVMLVGEVVWLTIVHPVWIFNLFLLARMVMEFFMPGYFVPIPQSPMKHKQMPMRAPIHASPSQTRVI